MHKLRQPQCAPETATLQYWRSIRLQCTLDPAAQLELSPQADRYGRLCLPAPIGSNSLGVNGAFCTRWHGLGHQCRFARLHDTHSTIDLSRAMDFSTIFHQRWWLDAAAGDRWQEVRTTLNSGQSASLKVFRTSKWGIPMLGMPPLSHTLGPEVHGLEGKPEAIRRMRLYLLDSVIRQLPRHFIFNQVLNVGDLDALAFRLNNFSVNVEYTYRIENCSNSDQLLANMRDTLRRVIRRAEENLEIRNAAVSEFVTFYFQNLARQDRSPNHSPEVYARVLEAGLAHGAVELFVATGPDKRLRAGVCAVFDKHTMYYLLTTQDRSLKDNGSVAVLIWNAIQSAGEKGLAFDFDGFGNRGAAVFLSQFGGALCPRLRISRMPKPLQGLMHLGPRFRAAEV